MMNVSGIQNRSNLSLDEDVDQVFGLGVEPTVDDTNDDAPANDTADETTDVSKQAADQPTDGADQQDDAGEPLRAPPRKDAQGNIVDENGNIVAATRQEKSAFYAVNRARAAADHANRELGQARQQLQRLQAYAELPKSLGLDMQAATEALQFRAKLDSDPVNTVREIVARVLQNGYTMNQLFGEDAPAQINAAIIKQQLDQKLGPITDRFAAQERESQIETRAREDLEAFVADHEYAELHGEHIARIVQEHGVTPEKAYYELRLAVTQRGFDFSKPLAEQFVASQGQPRNGAQQQQRPTPGARRPVTNAAPINDQQRMISPDTSFKDIVSMALKSARSNNMNT
jgi:hypothetical protein